MASKDLDAAKPIKMILSDVDGVLTDGSITIDNAGIESKTFNVRDGHAIRLWCKAGFQFGLLTARNSQIVKIRAAELGITLVRQGFSEKLPAAKEMIEPSGLDLSEVCYIGDDLPDLPVMFAVGLAATPADGANEVRQAADWIMTAPGGRGAVRELIERLLKAKGRWDDFVPNRMS